MLDPEGKPLSRGGIQKQPERSALLWAPNVLLAFSLSSTSPHLDCVSPCLV